MVWEEVKCQKKQHAMTKTAIGRMTQAAASICRKHTKEMISPDGLSVHENLITVDIMAHSHCLRAQPESPRQSGNDIVVGEILSTGRSTLGRCRFSRRSRRKRRSRRRSSSSSSSSSNPGFQKKERQVWTMTHQKEKRYNTTSNISWKSTDPPSCGCPAPLSLHHLHLLSRDQAPCCLSFVWQVFQDVSVGFWQSSIQQKTNPTI